MAKKPARKKCPVCGKSPVEGFQPFCSKHCADVDLARWLGGGYKIPTNEKPDEKDRAEEDE